MIEPEITVPVTTSFDQELPIPSWTAENYAIKMHGDLRSAKLMVDFEAGLEEYKIDVESNGRYSEQEKHHFRPDVALGICELDVQCLLLLHYDKKDLDWDEHVDIRLVLLPMGLEDDRIMRRIGYLETRYVELRDADAIYEDYWWRYVELR